MRIATGGWLLLAVPMLGVESMSVNCTFQSDPDEFLGHQAAMAGSLFRDTNAVSAKLSGLRVTRAISGHNMPRRNFIDVEIFDRLVAENVLSAPISSDEEFLHRITLDLAGRIPDAAEVRAFLADTAADKRGVVIDKLLNSAEFVDKWSQWLGDLLQNSSNAPAVATRGQVARNAYNNYIRASIADGKSLRDIAYETVAGKGNSNEGFGFSNFVLNGRTNGPIQDTYDMTMGGERISVSLATIEFKPAGKGTRMVVSEYGAFLDGLDTVAQREEGTISLIDQLGKFLLANP